MKYYSTNLSIAPVSFSDALLQGQAPDRGLYMPEQIPQVSAAELEKLSAMEYHEIAAFIIGRYLQEELPHEMLSHLTRDAYNFNIPLEPVYERKFVMRLDQGPTASFKDFAARLMARLMNHFLAGRNQDLLILTATSGDTGSAIAHAFLGLDRIKVVVLFPETEVTERQRKQMTTLGQNIHVVAVDGKFDDCQALVKEAFSDSSLAHLNLSSANSINIGRLLPQSVYYFYAWSRLAAKDESCTFSVPSGNFGDMMGGVLAMKMGLPVKKFIIAVNENDEFPQYLSTGNYQKIEPSRNCISSAMNVGHPSNLTRLLALYGGRMDEKGYLFKDADRASLLRDIWSVSVSDQRTRETIRKAWNDYHLLLEPHGAVGWAGMQQFISETYASPNDLFVVLETAHPAKFPAEIRHLLGFEPELPASLAGIEARTESFSTLENQYNTFKQYLVQHF